MSTAPKQLKKNDFLSVVTAEPMTREQLVDTLIDYEFIPSYLDFLVDHFEAQKKVQKNEDGSIQRITKSGGKAGVAYCVVEVTNDDGEAAYDEAGNPILELKEMATKGALTAEQKADGWSLTKKAACKKVTQEIFAQYKAGTARVNALLVEAETEETEA